MKRIHVTGPQRGGTTLMLELMLTCFEIDVYSKEETKALYLPDNVKPGSIICTKSPNDYFLIERLLDFDPNQWFICMVRDPRDVIVSRHAMDDSVYWNNLGEWNSYWSVVEPLLGHDHVVVVRYEKLVSTPDEVQQEIGGRMDFLEPKMPFSEYHLHASPSGQSLRVMGGVRPISDRSIGAWKRNKGRVV